MDEQTINDGKILAIVSYLTFIGLLIALFSNLEKKNPFVFFHCRQMLGLIIMLVASNVIEKYIHSWTGTLLGTITLVSWIFALVTAIMGKAQALPIIGDWFQQWFKNLQ